MTDRSDKADGPTAGTETVDPLKFLGSGAGALLVQIPDTGHVTTARAPTARAVSRSGMRGTAAAVPPAIVPAARLGPAEATRRWAALPAR